MSENITFQVKSVKSIQVVSGEKLTVASDSGIYLTGIVSTLNESNI